MRRIATFLLALLLLASQAPAAFAQDEGAAEGRVFQLADAYQDGFLKLAAVSCFSIYSSSGFIYGDYMNGIINGETAIDSMEQVALLQSVCYTSIVDVEQLTPETDTGGLKELRDIKDILEKENRLLSACLDLFSDGGEENQQAVKQALVLVERALDDYTSPPAE